MGDSLVGALQTSAMLVFLALPLTVASANALFLPWDGRIWGWTHARRVLLRHGLCLVALICMLIPENIEAAVDPAVTAALPWREAPTLFIRGYEEGFHAFLQAMPGRAVWQPAMATIYLAGFPYIIIATTTVAIWRDDGPRARRAAAAYALCFAFAVPFYLLLPVNEVWFAHDPQNHGAVQQLALQYPIVRDNLYAFNEVNNCFPSLHTAISVCMALVARGVPRFGTFALVLASLIVVSTQMLGIHWLTDVAGGIGLAFLVNALTTKWWPDAQPAATAAPAAPAGTGGA